MKKFAILALAAAMVVAFTLPASAFDSEFGGYWRTRAYTQQNFNGNDDQPGGDLSKVDTRTRIYYTAKFSEDFKFVNKFEFDADWGDKKDGYGDITADGIKVEIKNSYVDFNLDCYNFKIGVQHWVLARGFVFDEDFAGAIVTYNMEGIAIPLIWVKGYEGDENSSPDIADNNTADFDYYAIAPSFKLSDTLTIKPYFLWATTDEPSDANNLYDIPKINNVDVWDLSDNADIYYLGVDLDAKLDMASIWFTGVYEMGTIEYADGDDVDISAYLLAIGASADLGGLDVHGQVFYASGDDDADDDDYEEFAGPKGRSYIWSEIMGWGIFDMGLEKSAGAPGDQISNIWAANLGVGFAPMDKLKLKADLWYAQLAEDNTYGENELGTEIDLTATYKIMDNLSLDLIGAYLFAGDATSLDGQNEDDPYEIGTRLSLSF
ncbi:MAG: hypothetical protein JW786_04365 [Desulfobacterales bacterium]|nr:hypothetical protein [Desulfobacterales bacterium]